MNFPDRSQYKKLIGVITKYKYNCLIVIFGACPYD